MSAILNKKAISAVLFGGLIALASVAPALAASLNNDPQDFTTLRVTNYTSNPDCNACWTTSASVGVGEIVSFAIYYHVTGSETANNVRAKITPTITNNGSTIATSGSISADNAGLVSGASQVNLPAGHKATSLTHLATIWRPNQTISGSAALPFGQNGTEVFSGSGLNIGNVAAGWPTQGSVIVRYRIEGTKDVTPTSQGPLVNTLSVTDIDNTSARLRGEANPRGESTDAWFEWGTSSSNLSRETSHQSMGGGSSFVSYSNFVSGLEPNTDYFYRAIARNTNTNGTVRGDIRSFTTGRAAVDRPSVRILPATNITSSSALCRAEVNPNGSATTAYFEWGADPNNLLNRTGSISLGSGSNFVNVSSFLTGLNSNTTYYCRVVADNSAGRSISGLESFRTTGAVTPPSVITQVVRVFTGVAEEPIEEVVKLTLEADKGEVRDGRIVYTVTYENLTSRTLRDASIEVNLPAELEFDDASRSVSEIRGNTLVFELGTIRGGERGQIEIETTADNLQAGDVITVTATLSYIDTNNVRYIVAVEDISEITQEDLAGGGLTATILDALRDFFTNPIFWILLLLALLYLIYKFLTARREPPMYPPAAGSPTVVAYPPQAPGAPGAQMYYAPPQAPPAPPRPPEGPPFG